MTLNCSFLINQLLTLKNHIKMKKFNITSEKLATIGFTLIVWMCVLMSAAFALQGTNTCIDIFAAIGWLIIASLLELAKYKIINQKNE